ncbi:hypothetical protein [Pelagicoccus mobilis]|uniref:Uncharacterized protein n=1 Tax=Pelagicoccus mobilis TaxID=415221 RepID=A0A934S4G3_9BACT|nr:hypothetical protein [Pelagicoccus mobilis]MBK1879597.1 hypothetical protein [Pelagicoccus mobilis]
MNTQFAKSYPESKAAVLETEEPQATKPKLTEAQKERLARIKSAMNRTARERRMAAHR